MEKLEKIDNAIKRDEISIGLKEAELEETIKRIGLEIEIMKLNKADKEIERREAVRSEFTTLAKREGHVIKRVIGEIGGSEVSELRLIKIKGIVEDKDIQIRKGQEYKGYKYKGDGVELTGYKVREGYKVEDSEDEAKKIKGLKNKLRDVLKRSRLAVNYHIERDKEGVDYEVTNNKDYQLIVTKATKASIREADGYITSKGYKDTGVKLRVEIKGIGEIKIIVEYNGEDITVEYKEG